MGVSVTLEIYRLRIGSHYNFTQCRILMSCIKGLFWNKPVVHKRFILYSADDVLLKSILCGTQQLLTNS